jgi:DNA-binding winged helix-turn-helix (wHTH) protein
VIYRFGDHLLDTEGFRLTANGEEIAVEPQVFALLQFLIENCERVVSKDEIIEHVWDGRIVSDGTLNSRINSARRAVGDDGKVQAVIKTFPRRGFRFVAEVTEDAAAAPAAMPAPAVLSEAPSIAGLPEG